MEKNTIKKYEFVKNLPINTLHYEGSAYFLTCEIGRILDLGDSEIAQISFDKAGEAETADIGGERYDIISEAGLYKMINHSESPAADEFRTFYLENMLPEIHKRLLGIQEEEPEEAEEPQEIKQVGETFLLNSKIYGKIRYISENGELYFVVKDVARAIEHNNVTDLTKLVIAGVIRNFLITSYNPNGTPNRIAKTLFVNEAGLYEMLISSNKPKALPFRIWVVREVLPQIRETGTYSITPPKQVTTDLKPSMRPIEKGSLEEKKLLEYLNRHLRHGDMTRIAEQLQCRKDLVGKVKRGDTRSKRVMQALIERCELNRREEFGTPITKTAHDERYEIPLEIKL